MTLFDTKGNARIKMTVNAEGTPSLDFLDVNGKVVYSLPPNVSKAVK